MLRRVGIPATVIALLLGAMLFPAVRAGAQGNATPAAAHLLTNLPPGVSFGNMTFGQPAKMPASGPLVLERVGLPPGAATGMRAIQGPELIYVESGTVTAADNYGASSTLEAGNGVVLEARITYDVRNETTNPASLLRLRVAEATASVASPQAVATPTTTATVSVLTQVASGKLPNPATMFLAQATYAPGADTGPKLHAGPVGFLVQSGTLSVSSPSGLTQQLTAGKAFALPADVPHREFNPTSSPAKAFVFGVVSAIKPLYQAVAAPTVPAAPASTAEGTAAVSSATAGSVLQSGETVTMGTGQMTVRFDQPYAGPHVVITYKNIGTARADISISAENIELYDDAGNSYGNHDKSNVTTRVIILPGESRQFDFYTDWPDHDANMFVHFVQFGDIHDVTWGYSWINKKEAPLPPGTKDPKAGT